MINNFKDILYTFARRKFSTDETYALPLNISNSTFLSSFPRSGNTAFRLAMAAATSGDIMEPTKIDEVTIDLFQTKIKKIIEIKKSSNCIVKWHGYPYPMHDHNYCIYVLRDPISVCRSYYTYQTYRWKTSNKSPREYVSDFLHFGDEIFGTWSNHVSLWSTYCRKTDNLIVSFDDLIHRPEKICSQIKVTTKYETFDEEKFCEAINTKVSLKNKNGIDFFGEKRGHDEIMLEIDRQKESFSLLEELYKSVLK